MRRIKNPWLNQSGYYCFGCSPDNESGVKMETRFKREVSTNEAYLVLRAHVTEIKRNLVSIQATLSDSNGVCCTEAVCTYFTFTSEKARNMGLGNVELEEEEIDENVLAAALRGESVQ